VSVGNAIPALLAGVFLLGEKVSGLDLVGILGVLGGTYLIALPRGSHPLDFSQFAKQRRELALILIVILLWGIQAPLTKLGMQGVDIVNANFVRILGTVPLTGVMVLCWERHLKPHRVSPRYLGLAFLSAAVGYGSGGLLWLFSIQSIGSGMATVLSSTSPLLMIPLAAVFLKEKPTPRLWVGTALAVAGMALVFLG
ncbi:MAG: DMT family transporter, partial [Chloroflexota bacterium]|nr:DMT family transporter [Chloroflexota bacterium]